MAFWTSLDKVRLAQSRSRRVWLDEQYSEPSILFGHRYPSFILSVCAVLSSGLFEMAYYGQNGYGDDAMDIESSGPKVTVREVSHRLSWFLQLC